MATKQLTEEERHEYIRLLTSGHGEYVDEERVHIIGDNILCEILIKLGYADIVDAWDKIKKWYA